MINYETLSEIVEKYHLVEGTIVVGATALAHIGRKTLENIKEIDKRIENTFYQ